MDIRDLFDRDNWLSSIWIVENGYLEEGTNLSIGARLNFLAAISRCLIEIE